MSLKAAEVLELPDQACLGRIKEVGEAKWSESGVYVVVELQIQAAYAGKDGRFWLLFRPEWFARDFNPKDIRTTVFKDNQGAIVEADKVYGIYKRQIAGPDKTPAHLQILLGDDFGAVAAAFDNLPQPPEKDAIHQILRENLLGREVGYVMTQRTDKDEDGNKVLTEQYQVSFFFPVTGEGVDGIVKSSRSAKRKRALKITWPED